jgi:tetratricopeptide (TPR) repeat protein/transcriptional regulator with XRE-family HTH domain
MSRAAITRYCQSCGSHLASDHPGTFCSPCQAKQNIQHGPSEVPESFWSTDLMRDALASWHIGRVLTAYRTHPFHPRPISQTMVAGWVGKDQPSISRLENGPPVKDLDTLTFWARTLGIPPRLLWFAQRSAAGPSPARTTIDASPAGETGGHPGLPDLLAELTASDLPLVAPVTGDPVGAGAIDGLSLRQSADGLLKLFLHLDDEMGGDTLYVPLARYVSRLAVNARTNPGDGLPAFGQLSQMTGWLALDANRHAEARRYLTTAVYVAHQAHDAALAASSLAYMSLQQGYRGEPASALALAETAVTTGAGALTPLVETTLGSRLARAHAGLGNTTECLRAIERTRASFARAGEDEEPAWAAYVDGIEIEAQEGACYLDLAMTTQAAASLRRAVALLERHAPHRTRDRVHYLTRLAKCHLVDHEVEQACAVAHQALDLSRAIGSARVIERLGEFNNAIAPYENNSDAADFRRAFAAAAAA